MNQTRSAFVVPEDAIRAEVGIDIAAPPEQVASVYRDVEKWGETFAETIECVRITKTGTHWKQIEVTHKQEGHVPNTLYELSDTEIGLQEQKKKYDASFVNRFEPGVEGGAHYVIQAYVRLKGIYKVLTPFLKGYVRRKMLKQMRQYVLEPVKSAVEKRQA